MLGSGSLYIYSFFVDIKKKHQQVSYSCMATERVKHQGY